MNLKRLQKTIEAIGENIPKNDDWMPILILESKKEASIFGLPMKEGHKDETAKLMTMIVEKFNPDCACFVSTSWTLENCPENELDMQLYMQGALKISEHPNRVEVVCAFCAGERGESEGEVLMMGYIDRSGEHPRIKKWKISPIETESGGRFPDAIKEGFKLARRRT